MQNLVSNAAQLATVLRNRRKSRGLSQDTAAKKVGLLPKTVSALENRPSSSSIESLLKLLSALDLELLVAPKEDAISKTASKAVSQEDW